MGGVKVVGPACFQWSQPMIPQSHSPSSSQAPASAISCPSSKRSCRSDISGSLVYGYLRRLDRSALFGTTTKLFRTRSCELPKSRAPTLKRACSASLDAFSDEEFSEKIQMLAHRFQLSDEESVNLVDSDSETVSDHSNMGEQSYNNSIHGEESSSLSENQRNFPLDPVGPLDWSDTECIERKANSVELPLSIRIIKKKMQWEEGFREAGESAYCSVKKAFSCMVFIIRELHSYTFQMRELLFTEDLREIIVRVQKEMHASFVWLFQQVFSHTPTLMVYIMILLANFTVYSMGSNTAIAASLQPATIEIASGVEFQDQKNQKLSDSSLLKTFLASSSGGKSTSAGGNHGGGGGKVRPVASGTDGDGWSDRSNQFRTIVPDGVSSQLSSLGTTRETAEESVSGQIEEASLWNSTVEEARRMQASLRDESLDHETMQRFVSPITAKIEGDDYAEYFRTELLYQMGLSQEPVNPLLLANYAQFLYLVAHDYDRAEEYFKKAVRVDPPDAEAYSKYANFLWRVRKDLWAAEETFLEAISVDPTNSYHAANYAHFLWNTGGEDTCFPLNSPDNTQEI